MVMLCLSLSYTQLDLSDVAHSLIHMHDHSHIPISFVTLYFSCAHTETHRHPGQMIHPRNSVQHLADRVLSPATSPGLPFTGPLHILMDHLLNGMDGASFPLCTFYAI